MTQPVDFFFFYGSLYTYIAVMRIDAAAKAAGVSVLWRPFNLRAIMVEQDNVPARNPVKMRYVWRDLERRCQAYGLPFRAGPPYPIDPELRVNRVGTVAALEGWCPEFSRAVYTAWMRDHQAPHEHLETTLRDLGKNPIAVLAQADDYVTKAQFESETNAARDLGIFGAPTFAIGRELFWGGDRLDEAFAYAKGH